MTWLCSSTILAISTLKISPVEKFTRKRKRQIDQSIREIIKKSNILSTSLYRFCKQIHKVGRCVQRSVGELEPDDCKYFQNAFVSIFIFFCHFIVANGQYLFSFHIFYNAERLDRDGFRGNCNSKWPFYSSRGHIYTRGCRNKNKLHQIAYYSIFASIQTPFSRTHVPPKINSRQRECNQLLFWSSKNGFVLLLSNKLRRMEDDTEY